MINIFIILPLTDKTVCKPRIVGYWHAWVMGMNMTGCTNYRLKLTQIIGFYPVLGQTIFCSVGSYFETSSGSLENDWDVS